MINSRHIQGWVGLFVLSGLAALAILAFQVSGSNIRGDSYVVQAKFSDIGGLNVKAPVMIGGVKVGHVSKVAIDKNDYSPVVDLKILKTYNALPVDTGAAILTSGVLGAKFIGLSLGASEFYLENGDEIQFTQDALQLESIISQFIFSKVR